ncbi:MAG TPA: methylmalonyl Co-A mutase-associated GTPase MeaB, partial [Thermomicrobiales bacterium]
MTADLPLPRGRTVAPGDLSGLLARFRGGERRALARLLTQVENDTPVGREAVRALFGATGRAHVVGVTGPPGAGKSTLVNRLITTWRERGRSVAVVAVDPSSSLTGGATLGDRVRMMETWADEAVFIRSMATRGALGGLARATRGIVWTLDAFGFDMIIIETVGVGQDEVEVARVAHTTLLLQVPGLGDDIQAIKAGVLEVADLLVVNKADRPGAGELKRDLAMMLTLGGHLPEGAWRVPILATIAARGEGVVALADTVEEHQRTLRASGAWARRERATLLDEVQGLVRSRVVAQVGQMFSEDAHFEQMLNAL